MDNLQFNKFQDSPSMSRSHQSKKQSKPQSAIPGRRNKNYEGENTNSLIESQSADNKHSECMSIDDVSNFDDLNIPEDDGKSAISEGSKNIENTGLQIETRDKDISIQD